MKRPPNGRGLHEDTKKLGRRPKARPRSLLPPSSDFLKLTLLCGPGDQLALPVAPPAHPYNPLSH